MTVAIPTGSAVEAPPHHSRMGWAVLDRWRWPSAT